MPNIFNTNPGNVTYVFNAGYVAEIIVEHEAIVGNTDVLSVEDLHSSNQSLFRNRSNHLEVDIIGTTDSVTVQNLCQGRQHRTEMIKTSNDKNLVNAGVEQMVLEMASYAPTAAGQARLAPAYLTVWPPVLVAIRY